MATPNAELNQLRLIARTRPGTTYAKIIDEVLKYTFMVTEWCEVAASGSAVPNYGPFGAEWKVNYQTGNLANIVHELTHIACYLGYDNDFLCWPSTGRVKPPRRYERANSEGRVLNQADLQLPEMDQLTPLQDKGKAIIACVAGSDLNKEKAKMVIDKINYGIGMFGGVEFDPCINNVLGWLVEWGYPKKPGFFGAKNNVLYELVERAALAQYQRRTANARGG